MTHSELRSRSREVVLRHLEPATVEGVRRAAFRAGLATAAFRMLPDLVVVGAQRSGTTTLFRLLSEHPSIVRPTFSKGVGYFDVNYENGLNWYRGHFPTRVSARWVTRKSGSPLTFESSGYYLYHPLAAQRIAADLPKARIVALVRDPVERAYSAYTHEAARGFEDESFPRAIDMEESRLKGEVERICSSGTYQSFEHRHHSYLARGRYSEQLDLYRQHVGSERLFVMDADRFFAGPVAEFVGLTDWLGLPRWIPPSVDIHNARPRVPLDPGLRRSLEQYFAPWDKALEAYLGRPASWRS